MKTSSIIILTLICIVFFGFAYYLIWNWFIKPIRNHRKNEYNKLYQEIYNRLHPYGSNERTRLEAKELDKIRIMLCELESLKYKNSEMTEVITLDWVKKKYGLTKEEMALIN
jgi:hypothetical protein